MSTTPQRPLVILFAKAPIPGRVKTRLLPVLSPARATALHDAMVEDTLTLLASFGRLADVELHTDLPTDAWPGFDGPRRLQSAGDLGQRLLAALSGGLDSGRPLVLILGSDSPGLPHGHIELLLECPGDVRLGPASDGGYYAIAARRTHPRMFHDVRWSTPQTLAGTLIAVRAAGLSADAGEPWFDIDEPVSLTKLPELTGLGPKTAAWLSAANTASSTSG